MDKYKAMLLKVLGLPETADDAAIEAGCTEMDAAKAKASESEAKLEAVANRAAALETEVATFKAAALDAEAEAFCNQHAAHIADRPKTKALFVANRQATIDTFSVFKPTPVAPAMPVVHNRASAVPPGVAEDTVALRNRKVAEKQASNKCDFSTAWNAVRAESPELFV